MGNNANLVHDFHRTFHLPICASVPSNDSQRIYLFPSNSAAEKAQVPSGFVINNRTTCRAAAAWPPELNLFN